MEKAVNATTVKVAFKDAVENLNSLDFKIDGLTVSNAAVKQTNDKTVVLTTAVQKGGEKYTVTLNEKAIGSLTGVSSVIPTSIKMTQQSVQGKVGQQVILSADVGVKQAGIPVTFNVDALSTTLNKDQVFEAVTNEDGIATFSYTQYNAGNDAVAAYPTGAPSVRSLGYVFWGVDNILTVEEVTEGSTVNNGANKTYKVVAKDPKTGNVVANQVLNVSFLENLNTTADKVSNATVNGVNPVQFSNGTKTETAQITTDSKSEATFTVSGTNTAVTPVVFAANHITNTTTYSKKYEADLLQKTAPKITFTALQQAYLIELARDGGETAATGEKNGRKYNLVVKDKDGKLAKNEIVNVAFNEDLDRVISTNTKSEFIKVDAAGNYSFYPDGTPSNADGKKQISVKTNDKGEASFVIGTATGNVNDYATPIAWIDINNADAKQGKLDEGEPSTVGAITYFVAPYLDGAALKVYDENKTKEVKEFKGNEVARFEAELVNQSGKALSNTTMTKVTYTVFNEGQNDVVVDGQTISPNRSHSVTYEPGKELKVKPVGDKNAAVRVVATGVGKENVVGAKEFAFTATEAKATFTGTSTVTEKYTGAVEAISKTAITFTGKDTVTLKDATFYGGNGAEIYDVDSFIDELTSQTTTPVVSYSVDADGKKVFKVVRFETSGTPAVDLRSSAYVSAVTTTAVPTGLDGSLVAGDKVDIELTFNEALNIAGTPTLALNAGAGGTLAGTVEFDAAKSTDQKIVFTYTVRAADVAPSITLGTFTATGLSVKSDANKSIENVTNVTGKKLDNKVDAEAPTITSVTSGTLNHTTKKLVLTVVGAAKVGDTVDVSKVTVKDTDATISYALTTSTGVVTDGTTLTITLSDADAAALATAGGSDVTVDVANGVLKDAAGNVSANFGAAQTGKAVTVTP